MLPLGLLPLLVSQTFITGSIILRGQNMTNLSGRSSLFILSLLKSFKPRLTLPSSPPPSPPFASWASLSSAFCIQYASLFFFHFYLWEFHHFFRICIKCPIHCELYSSLFNCPSSGLPLPLSLVLLLLDTPLKYSSQYIHAIFMFE